MRFRTFGLAILTLAFLTVPDRAHSAPAGEKDIRPVTWTYKTVGDLPIKAEVYRLPGDEVRPVIVWIHGGALIVGQRTGPNAEQRRRYLEAGYVIVSIDYRLAPEKPCHLGPSLATELLHRPHKAAGVEQQRRRKPRHLLLSLLATELLHLPSIPRRR